MKHKTCCSFDTRAAELLKEQLSLRLTPCRHFLYCVASVKPGEPTVGPGCRLKGKMRAGCNKLKQTLLAADSPRVDAASNLLSSEKDQKVDRSNDFFRCDCISCVCRATLTDQRERGRRKGDAASRCAVPPSSTASRVYSRHPSPLAPPTRPRLALRSLISAWQSSLPPLRRRHSSSRALQFSSSDCSTSEFWASKLSSPCS